MLERKDINVIVAFERSGIVREAYRRLGFNAWSVDLVESEHPSPYHIVGDALEVMNSGYWHHGIMHPPCTYVASSGYHRNYTTPGRYLLTEDAMETIHRVFKANIHWMAIENPKGIISTRIMPASQIIQPYQFGHCESKETCLWLKNLPKLVPTYHVPPDRIVEGKKRYKNQLDSGQSRLSPGPQREHIRSRTYIGISEAFAAQWGNYVYQEMLNN